MSFLTGTNVETIYSSTAVGLSKSTFAVETQLNTFATMGVAPHLPPDFWLPNNPQVGRGIKILARGVLSTASTAPTFTLSIRGGVINNVSAAPQIAATAAFTPGASITNGAWRAEVDIFLTAVGSGGTGTLSTIMAIGEMIFPATAPGWAMTPIWGAGASPGTTTLETDITNYISVNANCGTSSASNVFALNALTIFGLN